MGKHLEVEESIAAYVLHAGDEGSTPACAELLDHELGCDDCRDLHAELRETVGELALTAPSVPITEDLRARVLSVTTHESAPVVRQAKRGRAARGLLVATLTGLLALGGTSAYLAARLGDAREQRAQTQSVLSFINDPRTAVSTVAGPNGRMTFAVREDGRALLVGSNLRLPPDRLFEIWLIRGPKVVPAGTFVPAEGRAVVEISIDTAQDLGIAITIERERVPAPTSTPVFQSSV